jgi:hypothetical protein
MFGTKNMGRAYVGGKNMSIGLLVTKNMGFGTKNMGRAYVWGKNMGIGTKNMERAYVWDTKRGHWDKKTWGVRMFGG